MPVGSPAAVGQPAHAGLLRLWTEAYARSLVDPTGPWGDFARATVADWLGILGDEPEPTAVLALLRGAMLDLLATGDRKRVDRAVAAGLKALGA